MNPRTGLIGQVAPPLATASSWGENHRMRRRPSRGQVVVETAIVMPVFVFLILGLLQLGLMHHARVMSKYASYKAVRAGSVNRGEVKVMENAALAVLLPVVGRDSTAGAPYRTDSTAAYDNAWNSMNGNQQGGGIPFVEVIVCNPKRGRIAQNADFDDARQAMGQGPGAVPEPPDPNDPPPPGTPPPPPPGVGTSPNLSWQGFNSSKLQIQVTVFYRMYIPFANWMVWRLAVGEETGSPKKQRWLGWEKDPNSSVDKAKTLKTRLMSLADSKKYIMPIRSSYAMRMQSNFSRRAHRDLPNGGGTGTNTGKNDSQCRIPWATQ